MPLTAAPATPAAPADPATTLDAIRAALATGTVVPCLGPGTLAGVVDAVDQRPIPADSDSLILAMTGGTPMAPRLMHEFPRAAMHLENRKGRSFIERFLTQTYRDRQWTRSALHAWIAGLRLPYVIDFNRDTQLQALYADRPHTLVLGAARLTGTHYRFDLHEWDGLEYRRIGPDDLRPDLPLLFKPLGSPLPKPSYVASDADFVDYITELMGGFAIPGALKEWRLGKRYLMLGMHFNRDTERMVTSDLIWGAATPAGWALIPGASDKELRYCARQQLERVDADWPALLPAQ
jgi:hypothetical protein